MAVIETARNLGGLDGAHSTEIDPKCADPVISLLDDQKRVIDKGGTMRLGLQPMLLDPGRALFACYDYYLDGFQADGWFRAAVVYTGDSRALSTCNAYLLKAR